MDVIVRASDDEKSWTLSDLLGRTMGVIVEEAPQVFVVRPAGNAADTMRDMRTGPFPSLDQALAAIETHTRGVCRRGADLLSHGNDNSGDSNA
jgi:hypothetical protein